MVWIKLSMVRLVLGYGKIVVRVQVRSQYVRVTLELRLGLGLDTATLPYRLHKFCSAN